METKMERKVPWDASGSGVTTGFIQVKKFTGLKTSYPRNGNAHNARPEVSWVTFVDGKRVGISYTRRAAVLLGNDFVREGK